MKDTSTVCHRDTMDQGDPTIESDKFYDGNKPEPFYNNIEKNTDMDCIKQVIFSQKFI